MDGTFKELGLRHIKTLAQANALLEDGFVDHLNQKFGKSAKNPESACRPLNEIDLNQGLCFEYRRQVQHDWTFSFKGQCYQIKKAYGSTVKPKIDIVIRSAHP